MVWGAWLRVENLAIEDFRFWGFSFEVLDFGVSTKVWDKRAFAVSCHLVLARYPNAITYNAAISACAVGGWWQKSLMLLEDLTDHMLQPTEVTYAAVISACEVSAEWHLALSLLQKMEVQQLSPSTVAFNAAISTCTRAAEWQQALQLLDLMENRQLRPDVTSSLV